MLPRGADIARHKESLVATKAESTHRMGAQQNKDDIHKITFKYLKELKVLEFGCLMKVFFEVIRIIKII